jgi:hypothetical protein
LLGSSNNLVLLHGVLGPTNSDKHLMMPSGGKLSIHDSTNLDRLSLYANTIESVDRGGFNYPNTSLSFKFTGNSSADLLLLNHAANPMQTSPNYEAPPAPRPYAELNGDLRLRGSIRFNDSTSLSSSSFLQTVNVTSSGLNTLTGRFNSLIVEGYVTDRIAPPQQNQKTSGYLITKNNSWDNDIAVQIFNRDHTLDIHAGAYVIAMKINNEYRPIWISEKNTDYCCK